MAAPASQHQPSWVLADKDSNLDTQEMMRLEDSGCPLLDPGAISPP